MKCLFVGSLAEGEEEDDDEGEDEEAGGGEDEYRQEQLAKLDKEREGIMADSSLIAEVGIEISVALQYDE